MKLLPIIVTIAILSGCASAPPRPVSIARGDYSTTQAYITKLIQHEMKKNSVEGLSIALVDDQHIIWAQGFGYADEENHIPATADTLYRVGSVSKLLTDTAAMQLVEQGKLDLDQPLKNYIPNFSIKSRYPGSADITPRLLMTHHSGLPRDQLKGFMTTNPAPFTELVDDIRDEYTAYPPNLIVSYSNIGISLLGNAIQNQSGMPFADFMKQSLLIPLGMKNSSFDTGLSASSFMAKGYRGRSVGAEPALRDVPAGGLNSSVNDLSRFISMVFAGGTADGHQIIQDKTLAEMLRPQNTSVALDFDTRIGLGWWLDPKGKPQLMNAGTVASHNGATDLFWSQLFILPEQKLGVVVLSNSSTAGNVVSHIGIEVLSLALEVKTGIHQPEQIMIQPDKKPLTTAEIHEYVGDYTTLVGFAQITACGDRLCAHAADHNFQLIRGEDGLFRLNYSLLGIFHINLGFLGQVGVSRRAVAGRDLLIAHVGDRKFLAGQRIEPIPNLAPWRHYLGDYEITNLGAEHKLVDHIKLVEEYGYLFIEVTAADPLANKARMILKPISDYEGILLTQLGDGGETVRVEQQDGEDRVLFSGYQFRKIVR
jgi:CubicO group peptidase (beta-lactamase class C family)